ncbi:MAG: chromosomal replication initiator protein DnaA [Thermodesulfobacteriota bacterium]|nr:chromosomal replication initiator protein DnaA [Thermodesulfobacteriota bacterium]|tara:strand:- start:142 stop:1569 length:1428 start_codon:yes stop_codon:yes gene_type:complete
MADEADNLRNLSQQDHVDSDLVDKNVLAAMIVDNIAENYPGITHFFDTLKLVSLTESEAFFSVTDVMTSEWINNHYMHILEKVFREESEEDLGIKKIHVDARDATVATGIHIKKEKPKKRGLTRVKEGQLNGRQTFDNFVKGASNTLAGIAAERVAERPGQSYNPLFIYGRTGLGKTHLLNAIGNNVYDNNKEFKIISLTAEHFTNRVVSAIRSGKQRELRDAFRFGCDVLLIDDIQFISGKEGTQQEFFHTFNNLYDLNKQIVLTCDKPPHQLSGMQERLIGRFEWGFSVEVLPPDLEHRVAILQTKAKTMGLVLEEDVLFSVAEKSGGSIRELEGFFNNVVGQAAMLNAPLNKKLVNDVASRLSSNTSVDIVNVELIQKEVAAYYGTTIADICSKKRTRGVVRPRQVGIYLSRVFTDDSLLEIGRKFGGRDHSTVLHSVATIEDLLAKNPSQENPIRILLSKIRKIAGGKIDD